MVFWFIALLSWSFIGNLIPKFALMPLKKGTGEPSEKFISILGFFEILIYAVSWILKFPAFIVVWFLIKMLRRRKAGAPAERINIFLLGNIIAVFVGVVIGIFFRRFLVLIYGINFLDNILP
ncbi:MAG: hypothetical protein AMJ95_13965 [Omnitrophica WOR_2 bacterium SM23_72]|nr:MAG: hypothetical protein AMJ95_13965 [Omnitrophica WOR_2 bacterium SM23_72]